MKRYITDALVVLFIVYLIFWGKHEEHGFSQSGTVINSTYSQIINCNSNYKKITLNIDLNNTSSEDEVKVKIIDPNGNLLCEEKANKNDSLNFKKTEKGIKGDYRVEFEKGNDTSSYNFTSTFH